MKKVRLEFLGTGTSQGVPMIGCSCKVCSSSDPHDKRLRASVLVDYCGKRFLVDAGPDFRQQMLRAGVSFNYLEKSATQIYCEKYVEESLRKEYSYAFAEEKYPGAPEWEVHLIDDKPFSIDGVEIIPIRGKHFTLPVLGYRFGDIAYCTDMNRIPDEEFAKLEGLDHFIINCVRRGRHISHFSLEGALEVAARVGARHTWLTHLSHQLPRYEDLLAELPEGVEPAYDGLVIY